MNKYIIYSGGGKGYGLYAAHPEFPESYKQSIEDLYEKQHIAGPVTDRGDQHCFRFAPLQDGYVLSVIYKNCTCAEEQRHFFASVNWVGSAEEADDLFGEGMEKNFFRIVLQSDELLRQQGYRIPDMPPPLLHKQVQLSEDARAALAGAALYATRAAQENRPVRAQVFLGRSRKEGLFDSLFWLLRNLPPRMRKHLSFHLGASVAAETFPVALAITYDDILKPIAVAGNYVGTMTARKIALAQEELLSGELPAVALAYARLSAEEREQVNALFFCAEAHPGYWQYISALQDGSAATLRGIALAKLLGESNLVHAIEGGLLDEDGLLLLYDQQAQLAEMPLATAALIQRAKPLADRRLAEQQAKARAEEETERLHREPTSQPPEETPNDDTPVKTDVSSPGTLRRLGNGIHRFVRRIWPVGLPIGCFLIAIGLGIGMYCMSVWGIPLLPKPWRAPAYGAQIAVLLLVAMPLGHLLFSSLRRLRRQKPTPSQKEESR